MTNEVKKDEEHFPHSYKQTAWPQNFYLRNLQVKPFRRVMWRMSLIMDRSMFYVTVKPEINTGFP